MQLVNQPSVEPEAQSQIFGKDRLRVGVVGYSAQAFNQETALLLLQEVFDLFEHVPNVEVISGLTQLGVPALAYEEAVKRGWRTVGVACAQAFEYKCFPVDEVVIVGANWGDESSTFLSMVDVLVRIGGGRQSHQEVDMARVQGKYVMEFELPASLSP
ncbi:MAG: hypothetical protein QNJ46_22645 [Leptolyngbyaceae cyanobacterium MO_188.B28]|nr:hypothetical protein [Leptolyngbyaceae cyanobacterium MO_188.B28]